MHPMNNNIMKKVTGWKYLYVEISHPKNSAKKYIISNIYRKPGEVLDEFNVFLEEFTSFLIYILTSDNLRLYTTSPVVMC